MALLRSLSQLQCKCAANPSSTVAFFTVQPMQQSIRYLSSTSTLQRIRGVKWDPTRPREPDFEKKLLLAVMEPAYRKNDQPLYEQCEIVQAKKEEPHPYVQILAADCKSELSYPHVYIFHMNFGHPFYLKKMSRELKKRQMYFRSYSNEILHLATEGSRFERLQPILMNHGAFAFSNKSRFTELNKLLKEYSFLVLLGGVIEGRIMNKQELIDYNQLPSIDHMRAQLCHTLSLPLMTMSQSLAYHMSDLSSALQRHSSGKTGEPEAHTELGQQLNEKSSNE